MPFKPIAVAAICLFVSTSAYAHRERKTLAPRAEDAFTFLSRFTVKVENTQASIFHFKPEFGHGSGFIVDIQKLPNGEEIGTVFTNEHVSEYFGPLRARNIKILFQTDTDIPEEVNAEIAYISEVTDFAILRFKLKDLKYVRDQIRPAPIPKPDSPVYQFSKNFRSLQGLPVLAHGSPLDAEAATTNGIISAKSTNWEEGEFVQTDASINGGNSGGPLLMYNPLTHQVGDVIGMNTWKMTGDDVDNVGNAIPIGVLMEEYKAWLKDPKKMERVMRVAVHFRETDLGELDRLNLKDIIKKKHPDYFRNFKRMMMVDDADPATNLRPGDVLLTINGKMATPSLHQFNLQMQMADDHVDLEVVRGREIVKVRVPVSDETEVEKNREERFALFSGLLFREARQNYFNRHDSSKVLLSMHVSTKVKLDADSIPSLAALLEGVGIDGEYFKITNIQDLVDVLGKHRDSKFIQLYVKEAMKSVENGQMALTTDAFDQYYHSHTVTSYVIPLTEIVLPSQFSIKEFSKQVNFDPTAIETQIWQDHVKEPDCAKDLGGKRRAPKKKKV